MARTTKQQRPSFADVVVELRARGPQQPRALDPRALDPRAGGHPGVPIGPDQVVYDLEGHDLTPAEALAAVGDGAAVAWDGCGCGDPACRIWLDAAQRAELVEWGRPLASGRELHLWTNAAGDVAVLADTDVVWGSWMA